MGNSNHMLLFLPFLAAANTNHAWNASARLDFLSRRIDHTEERRLFDAAHNVETARLYGNVNGYAYWFIDILVGTPPQRVSVIADTGSTLCGFTCTGCKNCGHHIDHRFAVDESSTFNWVQCDRSASCTCKRDGVCHYYQSYTEGSSIGGKLFTDYVRIGDEFQHNPSALATMGCHQTETNLFVSQKANGIMGLAVSTRYAKPSILPNLFHSVDSAIFSLCLSQEGGEIRVGGNEEYYTTSVPDLRWIPLLSIHGVYSITLTSFKSDTFKEKEEEKDISP